jgi:hypothetical protein
MINKVSGEDYRHTAVNDDVWLREDAHVCVHLMLRNSKISDTSLSMSQKASLDSVSLSI